MHKIRSFAPPSFRASTRRLASILFLAAAACAALAPAASAISMRNDVPSVNSTLNDNPYVAFGSTSQFDAVGFVQFTNTAGGSATGSGMLVATSTPGVFKFLTAAHNVDGGANGTSPNGLPDAASYDIYFGARTAADGSASTGHVTVPASGVSISPQWVNGGGGLAKASPQYDVAVITFTLGMVVSGTLPTNPLGFMTTSPLGKTGVMVGYGNYGLGGGFANNAPDGLRRAGQNTIDFVATATSPANTGFTLQTDFDSPTDATRSTLGSVNPLALESSTAAGDGGGPLLVNNGGTYQIAGVLNGDYAGTGGNVSEYGDRAVWASVTQSDNMAYLAGQGVAGLVPEPSTWATLCLGVGLLGFVTLRRRRAARA